MTAARDEPNITSTPGQAPAEIAAYATGAHDNYSQEPSFFFAFIKMSKLPVSLRADIQCLC
jgi:hypothetical protein